MGYKNMANTLKKQNYAFLEEKKLMKFFFEINTNNKLFTIVLTNNQIIWISLNKSKNIFFAIWTLCENRIWSKNKIHSHFYFLFVLEDGLTALHQI